VTASNPNLALSSRFKLELYGRKVEYTKRTMMAKGMKLAPSSVKEIFCTFLGACILCPRVLESTKVRSSCGMKDVEWSIVIMECCDKSIWCFCSASLSSLYLSIKLKAPPAATPAIMMNSPTA
jgi:hypothetical protein